MPDGTPSPHTVIPFEHPLCQFFMATPRAGNAPSWTFALPAPADDSFLFADLTGRGRRQDLVVKDRYWNLWGISFEGQTLWHWRGSTGHFSPPWPTSTGTARTRSTWATR
jgi:hypothetical protein